MGSISLETVSGGSNSNGAKLDGKIDVRALNSATRVLDFETKLTVPNKELK